MLSKGLSPLKEMFEVWEKHNAVYWEEFLRSSLFLGALGSNLELTLGWQRNLKQASESYWRMWGIPTRADQELSLHQLNQLEAELGELTRRVDRLLAMTE